MSHYKIVCACGVIVEECRCPAPQKSATVSKTPCPACLSKDLRDKIKDSRKN